MVERRGRDYSKNMYERPMDRDNSVGIDCGSGGWAAWSRAKEENWDNYDIMTIKNLKILKAAPKGRT